MDAGRVAEFGTPLELYRDEASIFHSMCVKSNITADEIIRNGCDTATSIPTLKE